MGERLVGEIRERRTAPELERRPQQLCGLASVAAIEGRAALGSLAFEAIGVDLVLAQVERVAAAAGDERARRRGPCEAARRRPARSWSRSPVAAPPRARRRSGRPTPPRGGEAAGSRARRAAALPRAAPAARRPVPPASREFGSPCGCPRPQPTLPPAGTRSCPLATAVNRAFTASEEASVDGSRWTIPSERKPDEDQHPKPAARARPHRDRLRAGSARRRRRSRSSPSARARAASARRRRTPLRRSSSRPRPPRAPRTDSTGATPESAPPWSSRSPRSPPARRSAPGTASAVVRRSPDELRLRRARVGGLVREAPGRHRALRAVRALFARTRARPVHPRFLRSSFSRQSPPRRKR